QDSLGNTIQNSRQIQLNLQGNFETLYNKIPRLKQINQGKPKAPKTKDKTNPDKKDGFGKDLEDPKDKKEKVNPLDIGLRFLMMVRNVSGSYTRNEGMLLPGYNRNTRVAGMDSNFEGPGAGFLFGEQNTDIWGNETDRNYALFAASQGWLVQAPFLNNQYSETFSETWNAKMNLEPVRYLRIEISANRQEGRNLTSFFRYNAETGEYVFDSPMETGNFTASLNTWATAFSRDNVDDNYNSAPYLSFLDYRLQMSERLNAETYNLDAPEANGYYAGWGPASQNVVIPAFIAAYSGKSPDEVQLNPFATRAQPNWRVTYDGLTKLPAVKKHFKQFNINHQYRSTVTASYVTNLNYTENADGLPNALDQAEVPNWIPEQQINPVTITENLSPLIGFDMTIKTKKTNDPQLRV
ncbi:MAG: cell surface protein SprA, partial [Bacteroidota bacterium]